MTCYLAQSVVWAVAFTPFLLDLSDTLTVATTALLASRDVAGHRGAGRLDATNGTSRAVRGADPAGHLPAVTEA